MNCGFNAELSNSYPWIQIGMEPTTLINPLLPLSPCHSYLFLFLWLLLSTVSLYHRVGRTPCRSYHRAVVKCCNLTKLLVLFLKHLGIVKNIHFGEIFSILFRFFRKMLSVQNAFWKSSGRAFLHWIYFNYLWLFLTNFSNTSSFRKIVIFLLTTTYADLKRFCIIYW